MAAALDACLASPDTPLQVVAHARRRLFSGVRLVSKAKSIDIERPLSCLPLSAVKDSLQDFGTPQAWADRIIIVTPPPQYMDEATRTLVQALAEGAGHGTGTGEGVPAPRTAVFLMGNGLLEDDTLTAIEASHSAGPLSNVIWFRALALAGFQSDWLEHDRTLLITHTGGDLVLCGQYHGSSGHTGNHHPHPWPLGPSPRTRTETGPGPGTAEARFLCGPLLRATEVRDIRALELRKFFVNTVLGWCIGPENQSNGYLRTALSEAGAKSLAGSFSRLFPAAGRSEDLCELLWQTVAETSQNLNSVSRAWRDGDPTLAYYFRDTILAAMARNPQPGSKDSDLLLQLLTSRGS